MQGGHRTPERKGNSKNLTRARRTEPDWQGIGKGGEGKGREGSIPTESPSFSFSPSRSKEVPRRQFLVKFKHELHVVHRHS
jgi:hypothetical protein